MQINPALAQTAAIFAELLKALTLEAMFRGFGGGTLADRAEMMRRLRMHAGAQ